MVKSILITILFFILDGNKSTKERLFPLTLPMLEAQNCFLLFMYYQMYMQCCSIIQIDFICKKKNNQNVCRFHVNNIPMYVTCMCYLYVLPVCCRRRICSLFYTAVIIIPLFLFRTLSSHNWSDGPYVCVPKLNGTCRFLMNWKAWMWYQIFWTEIS